MDYFLKVQAEAVIDIQYAFEWYKAKRDGLSFEFIEEIETGLQNICKHPQYYSS